MIISRVIEKTYLVCKEYQIILEEMDEAKLIERAKKGDVRAFNQLVLHYQNAVYNFACRMMGDGDSADDVTQETFVAVYRSIHSYREGEFRAWLFRIARNKSLDHIRKRQRHPEPSLDQLTEENDSPTFIGTNDHNPEDEQERQEMNRAIQECLDGLSADQRAVILLCDVESFDYSEIATSLELSLGTVKSRINRARQKLQLCLRTMLELLPDKYR